jgi:apolipoprotein N-acyltransferase
MIERLRHTLKAVSALESVPRNAVAFMFGVAGTMTLPPFFVFPLVLMAYGGLFLLVHKAPTRKRAFADGWWWGWGYYITGLYWFTIALTTDMAAFGWMIPFALFGVTAFIALYPALACLLFYSLPGKRGTIRRIFVFSLVWTLVEFARGHLLTGFPWNIPGNSFAMSDTAIQLASVFGAYGLSFWAVLLGACIAAIADEKISYDRSVGFVLILWLGLVGGLSYGEQRLKATESMDHQLRYEPDILLRLVQPNIAQPHKWEPAKQMEVLQKHIRLTQSSGLSRVTHVIWPETALPYVVRPNTPLLSMVGSALPEKSTLLTGALRIEGEGKDWQIFNSILEVNHNGTVLGSYDKSKLVPFGEFLPLRSFIPDAWLTPVGDRDFSRGQGVVNVKWSELPLARPMICYEVIFPEWGGAATDNEHELQKQRPRWFLNVTNDAWFGLSSGPYQHFHMARMRAVEQGIPLVRVANTGISAVIDPYGRIESQLPLNKEGIIDAQLPKAIENTPYNTYNRIIINALILFLVILVAI